jgi:hypothetical protein
VFRERFHLRSLQADHPNVADKQYQKKHAVHQKEFYQPKRKLARVVEKRLDPMHDDHDELANL